MYVSTYLTKRKRRKKKKSQLGQRFQQNIIIIIFYPSIGRWESPHKWEEKAHTVGREAQAHGKSGILGEMRHCQPTKQLLILSLRTC